METAVPIPADATLRRELVDQLKAYSDRHHERARGLQDLATTDHGKERVAPSVERDRGIGDALHALATAIQEAV